MQTTPVEPKSWRKKRLWRILGWLAVALTFFWVGWILRDGVHSLFNGELKPEWKLTGLAFAGVIISMLIGTKAFESMMIATGARLSSFLVFSELYFTGMLMRHLPGRFFGVIYQAKKGNDAASPSQWIAGNSAFIIISTWLATSLSLLVLAIFGIDGSMISLGLVAMFLTPLLLFLTKRFISPLSIRTFAIKHFLQTLKQTLNALFSDNGLAALGWALLSWLPYAIAWSLLGESLPSLGWQAGLQLGAMYTLAWAAGYLSLIAPGGLGVRELVFAFLATHYPPEIIAYIAILARLGLLCGDICLGLFFVIMNTFSIKKDTNIVKNKPH